MNTSKCLNCNLESDAKFCPSCGQSKSVQLSSIWHLISETFDVIYNLDSKVWQSIGPLIFKPGKLTNEYIAGKRVRYLPPFRLYLILSILFFLVAAIPEFTGFDNQDQESIEDAAQEAREDIQESRDAIQEALQEAGLINDSNNEAENSAITLPIEFPEAPPELDPIDNNLREDLPFLAEVNECSDVPWSEFLGEFIGERALNSCQTTFADGGVTLMQSFQDNLPIMMFFCVPLLAVFMKFLYLFKGRKYVEHLMFLFHTHSFVFALLILTLLIARATEPFPALEDNTGLLLTVIWIYAAIYVFLALRRVYRQGIFMTSVKVIMLLPSYAICLGLTFASGLFLTFITI